jgi:hypothetical protein
MFPSLAGTRAKKLRKRLLWEWNEFGSKCKRPRDNADENAENPPFHRELGCLCKLVEKFHNYKLKCHSDHYN